jgi:hypothetical protein
VKITSKFYLILADVKLTLVVTKNIVRPDGKSRTLCALAIGEIPVKNSPHGIYNRTPYAFLTHDLGHANTVHSRLSREPEQYLLKQGDRLNVKKIITFIQPIIDGINEGRISDPIIDTFLFLICYEFVYHGPQRGIDSSSVKSFITSHEGGSNHNPEDVTRDDTYIYYNNDDPFFDICTSYGRDAGYYPRQNHSNFEWLTSPMQNHYEGIRHVNVNGKTASFSCVAKRTGEITKQSPYHEYAEVVDIELIRSEQSENTLSDEIISQILDLKGKKYVVPTLEGKATTTSSVYNLIQKTLGKQTSGSYFGLERELLAAFRAKVE